MIIISIFVSTPSKDLTQVCQESAMITYREIQLVGHVAHDGEDHEAREEGGQAVPDPHQQTVPQAVVIKPGIVC